MNKKKEKVQKKIKKNTTSNSGKIKKLNESLKLLTEQLAQSDEKNLRLLADFENFKMSTDLSDKNK